MNKIRIAGAAAGVVLVSGMVLQVSSAAFTGTTDNAGNAWTAGTVTLTDDDATSAMFSSTAQVPGDSETNCIEVTYTGNAALTKVDLYAAVTPGGALPADTLADDLDVTVKIGPASSACNLTDDGFVDDLTGGVTMLPESTVVNNEALALFGTEAAPETMGWVPSGTDPMRPFLFTVTLGSDTDNDAQGDTAGATFTWRASS